MADYKERFEKWQREAKERFDDFDKQIGLKEKIEEGAKVVIDTAERRRRQGIKNTKPKKRSRQTSRESRRRNL